MKRRAFTLIEMLVVMVIIGLLLGLLFPTMRYARERAQITKARDTASQLVLAWQAYLFDYRMFPSMNDDPSRPATITQMDKDTVSILNGQTYNSLGIKAYMEFTTNDIAKGILDPWNHLYQVALDNGNSYDGKTAAYDARISVPHQKDPIDKNVAVWSMGPDGTSNNDLDRRDDLKSWK